MRGMHRATRRLPRARSRSRRWDHGKRRPPPAKTLARVGLDDRGVTAAGDAAITIAAPGSKPTRIGSDEEGRDQPARPRGRSESLPIKIARRHRAMKCGFGCRCMRHDAKRQQARSGVGPRLSRCAEVVNSAPTSAASAPATSPAPAGTPARCAYAMLCGTSTDATVAPATRSGTAGRLQRKVLRRQGGLAVLDGDSVCLDILEPASRARQSSARRAPDEAPRRRAVRTDRRRRRRATAPAERPCRTRAAGTRRSTDPFRQAAVQRAVDQRDRPSVTCIIAGIAGRTSFQSPSRIAALPSMRGA